eukprot:TRINITY_DN2207_c0_g3_i1.p1 TRINITY_DN2207_c0_g3~~TRINITY_DN2207_c0_g3_i1.p1  ORF type:complete len:395 (+),score=46.76 TRINITY_DN2207_c0_g3_i1:421-1605(+)
MFSFIAVLFVGVVFLVSGLIVNLFQLLNCLFILPFSRKLYRLVNSALLELFWGQLVWLCDWWGLLEIRLYTEKSTFELMGKEHALLLANHRSDVDWVVGWCLAQRAGCLGGTRALMKRTVQFLPVIGWSMWFSEYIFLDRNWEKDRIKLERSFTRLHDFPRALWVAIFPEGTRFTPAKLQVAQDFAAQAGLHVPQNTLVPRTKGFVATVRGLRSFVPAIYNMTAVVPAGVANPTFADLLQRKPTTIHVHIQRHPMTELPEDDAGVAEWCKALFVKKDAMLDAHKAANTFGEELYVSNPRGIIPLLVVCSWSLFFTASLAFCLVRAYQANAITWTGGLVACLIVVVIAILMKVFLNFTQSEKSSSASKAKAKKPAAKRESASASSRASATHSHTE